MYYIRVVFSVFEIPPEAGDTVTITPPVVSSQAPDAS
jgi:hypothetical protein